MAADVDWHIVIQKKVAPERWVAGIHQVVYWTGKTLHGERAHQRTQAVKILKCPHSKPKSRNWAMQVIANKGLPQGDGAKGANYRDGKGKGHKGGKNKGGRGTASNELLMASFTSNVLQWRHFSDAMAR